jgi:hypothetical protein
MIVALRQMKLGTMKDHGHTCKFCLNIIFLDRPFEYGDGGIFELLRCM